MRKGSVHIGVAVLVAILAASTAVAQTGTIVTVPTNNVAYGTTTAEFLLIPATARGAALGGTFAALANDLGSMYYNPAGLALMERPGAMASSMKYIASTNYTYGAIGFPFSGGSRAFGLSVTTFGFSDQPVYTVEDPQGTSGQVYSVSETAIGGTYSQQFSDRFSAGITAKFVNDKLGDVSGSAFAVDFGTSFHSSLAGRAIRAAFVITNLGTNMSHSGRPLIVVVDRQPPPGQDQPPQEPARAQLQTKAWSLPVMFRVAVAYDAFATSLSRLTVLGEFNQPNNSQPGFSFGGEYNMALGTSGFSVAGRLGMTYYGDDTMNAPDATATNYAGFQSALSGKTIRMSAGGGLRYAKGGFGLGVDYAYKNYGLLGGVNMLGVSVNW
jgi:Uncharacterised protein family (UPF0164)